MVKLPVGGTLDDVKSSLDATCLLNPTCPQSSGPSHPIACFVSLLRCLKGNELDVSVVSSPHSLPTSHQSWIFVQLPVPADCTTAHQ